MDFLRNHQSLFLVFEMSAWIGATPAPPDVCGEKAFVEKGMKGLGLKTSGPGLNEPGEKMAFLIGTQPTNPKEDFYCSRFSMD
ncbi:MAG: hypothetical protein NTV04_02100 [Deltaproteobacteria bacterium]|nr:hypothetical protein [Deltaproteobacteria bacterium]